MEELIIQGEELLIIKGFEKIYVRAGDEVTTKHYVSVFPFTILLFDACTYDVYCKMSSLLSTHKISYMWIYYAKCQVY